MIAARPPLSRKRFTGHVVSAGKMAKTITVAVERFLKHPRVRKGIRRTRKFLVHDAEGSARVGDRVIIEETRPLSKRKHFRLLRVEAHGDAGSRREARDADAASVS